MVVVRDLFGANHFTSEGRGGEGVGVLDDFEKKINILQVHMGKIKIPAQVHIPKRNSRTDSRLETGTLKKNLTKIFSLSSARLFVLAIETIIFIKYLTFNLL